MAIRHTAEEWAVIIGFGVADGELDMELIVAIAMVAYCRMHKLPMHAHTYLITIAEWLDVPSRRVPPDLVDFVTDPAPLASPGLVSA